LEESEGRGVLLPRGWTQKKGGLPGRKGPAMSGGWSTPNQKIPNENVLSGGKKKKGEKEEKKFLGPAETTNGEKNGKKDLAVLQ